MLLASSNTWQWLAQRIYPPGFLMKVTVTRMSLLSVSNQLRILENSPRDASSSAFARTSRAASSISCTASRVLDRLSPNPLASCHSLARTRSPALTCRSRRAHIRAWPRDHSRPGDPPLSGRRSARFGGQKREVVGRRPHIKDPSGLGLAPLSKLVRWLSKLNPAARKPGCLSRRQRGLQ